MCWGFVAWNGREIWCGWLFVWRKFGFGTSTDHLRDAVYIEE